MFGSAQRPGSDGGAIREDCRFGSIPEARFA
jgi:hypothetical protein